MQTIEDFEIDGYIVNCDNIIEKISYENYLNEYGSEDVTAPIGVTTRFFIENSTIYEWKIPRVGRQEFRKFDTKDEAYLFLLQIREKNLWDKPIWFKTKEDLFEGFSEVHEKKIDVIKRYFSIVDAKERNKKIEQIEFDNRPFTTKEEIDNFISENKVYLKESLNELKELKKQNKKEEWHVLANSITQKASKNDFRKYSWKEVFNLIKKVND